uniref:Uncharacterized protein n=1 Tax=Romanomermis culicivorax TaxID=13658 RepID=A0A915KSN5_ROMCU
MLFKFLFVAFSPICAEINFNPDGTSWQPYPLDLSQGGQGYPQQQQYPGDGQSALNQGGQAYPQQQQQEYPQDIQPTLNQNGQVYPQQQQYPQDPQDQGYPQGGQQQLYSIGSETSFNQYQGQGRDQNQCQPGREEQRKSFIYVCNNGVFEPKFCLFSDKRLRIVFFIAKTLIKYGLGLFGAAISVPANSAPAISAPDIV